MSFSVCKVAFVLPNLNAGGAERVAINYVRQLNSNEYDVYLILLDITDELSGLLPKHVKIINLGTNSTKKSFFALLSCLRNLKPDVIYSTHSRIAVLMMFVRPFLSRHRYVARMQNMPSLEMRNGVYGRFSRWLYSLGFSRADVVIAQTEEMKKDAIDVFLLPENKVRVLHNPLDTKFIDSSVSDKSSPFAKSEFSAVASGRLFYAKGFDVLLRALPFVIKKIPNFKLYILGSDKGEFQNLQDIVSALGLTNHVVFLGFVSNPYPYYRYCDLFILSSRWEGYPNVLLENYYLNTPLVATNCIPIISDLIVDGANGYICESEDFVGMAGAIINCSGIKREDLSNDSLPISLIAEVLTGALYE